MRCLSLFSGCGGLDLGLEQAGFKIALAVDNWERSAQSHALNRPDIPILPGLCHGLDVAVDESTLG